MGTPAAPPTSAASEAWLLMSRLLRENRGPFFAACAEERLSPPQVMALQLLEPAIPTPMSDLAGLMHCDNSNVTGIVDRLEARGLVTRRPATHDRRIKHLLVTDEGAAVRARLVAQLSEPPEPLLRLSTAEQRQLRDLLRKALG
ncbi:MarR family transcriptional regulator [Paraconexibacter antarcticus]|uniref:MarR family transcriptional regulator n=1 Tax=Paraconexibacter antarcticus TaxID=2949664 RepID=A0ABY5DTM3_9ACTN|nr:MarR family transcriptional regulator [Paraconexibacter antarcticus]UTI64432.1 MarR family transcriptional regulator [Paraconexibacter antarcticus]